MKENTTGILFGVAIDFLAEPAVVQSNLAVMRGKMLPGVVIPLHSHADPEVIYLLEGSLEVYRSDGENSGWRMVEAGQTVILPGGVRHALRNESSFPALSLAITQENLYGFFAELALPIQIGRQQSPPKPEQIQALLTAASHYGFWLGDASENAAIGIHSV
jgi:quercetin dioxygenase-like cupin family protein